MAQVDLAAVHDRQSQLMQHRIDDLVENCRGDGSAGARLRLGGGRARMHNPVAQSPLRVAFRQQLCGRFGEPQRMDVDAVVESESVTFAMVNVSIHLFRVMKVEII